MTEPSIDSTAGSSSASLSPVAASAAVHHTPTSSSTSGGGGSGATTTTTSRRSTVVSLNDANEELSQLIIAGKISSDDVASTKSVLNDYTSLKEKVEKLKSLLGRSAKAQREAKIDLDASQKRLTSAMKEIERLHQKLDKLQTRPSRKSLLFAG
jgi:chromosome segregation ATPase